MERQISANTESQTTSIPASSYSYDPISDSMSPAKSSSDSSAHWSPFSEYTLSSRFLQTPGDGAPGLNDINIGQSISEALSKDALLTEKTAGIMLNEWDGDKYSREDSAKRFLNEDFEIIDADKNGVLSLAELKKELQVPWHKRSTIVDQLVQSYDYFKSLSNDQLLHESGISKKDIAAWGSQTKNLTSTEMVCDLITAVQSGDLRTLRGLILAGSDADILKQSMQKFKYLLPKEMKDLQIRSFGENAGETRSGYVEISDNKQKLVLPVYPGLPIKAFRKEQDGLFSSQWKPASAKEVMADWEKLSANAKDFAKYDYFSYGQLGMPTEKELLSSDAWDPKSTWSIFDPPRPRDDVSEIDFSSSKKQKPEQPPVAPEKEDRSLPGLPCPGEIDLEKKYADQLGPKVVFPDWTKLPPDAARRIHDAEREYFAERWRAMARLYNQDRANSQ